LSQNLDQMSFLLTNVLENFFTGL